MLIGYVSDERYLALEGVTFEFEGQGLSVPATSRASGAIHADLPNGKYEVTIAKPGYGAKRVQISVGERSAGNPSAGQSSGGTGEPYQFRLLSDGLLGYMWPKWIRSGEASEFRVHSTEAYKLELWRYGSQKQFVCTLGWFDDHGPRTTIQLTPDGDYTRTGIGFNRHGYNLTWHPQRVPAPDRSGLYYLHASTAAGGFFSFPWLVAPAAPRAPIAVLASNMTWNAYNTFGGRSNYVNQDQLPPRPIVHARLECKRFTHPDTWPYEVRAAPLSFDRPEPMHFVPEHAAATDVIEGRLASAGAPGLWRLLSWLEREAFEYDLYADTQLHEGQLDLDQYRVLVLDNHPEYWSVEMYRRVKRWVYEQGGRLAYLGGCGLLAEVEFADEHTIYCRREERADLRGEPAASLLGVAYSHSGYQTAAPYQAIDAGHWAFAGTGLKSGDRFGHRNLHGRCPGGASGHELDKISPDSPANLVHLAQGTNPGGGADLAMFATASGGGVFAAGSLCWTLSLLVDDAVSKVTANVLRRFLDPHTPLATKPT